MHPPSHIRTLCRIRKQIHFRQGRFFRALAVILSDPELAQTLVQPSDAGSLGPLLGLQIRCRYKAFKDPRRRIARDQGGRSSNERGKDDLITVKLPHPAVEPLGFIYRRPVPCIHRDLDYWRLLGPKSPKILHTWQTLTCRVPTCLLIEL